MSDELFDRHARVQMGTTRIEGLRVQFKAEKTNDEAPSTAEITVWNLAKTTRVKMVSGVVVPVVLEAGYGSNLELIFRGDILPAGISTVRQGPDWLTTFKAGDGLASYRSDRVQLKVTKGLTVKQAVTQLLGQFKSANTKDAIGKITSNQTLFTGAFQQFFNGTVLSGGAVEVLNGLIRNHGLRATFQDGQLELAPIGSNIPGMAVSLSPSTGLIGSPEPAKDKFVKFKCLLRPQIKPCRLVKVVCEQNPTGIFIVAHKVTHTGDTRGQEWYTDVEGKSL